MYLDKYLKSLCHAWGAVPIYLLGRYCLGVHDERIVVPAVQLVVGHLSIQTGQNGITKGAGENLLRT